MLLMQKNNSPSTNEEAAKHYENSMLKLEERVENLMTQLRFQQERLRDCIVWLKHRQESDFQMLQQLRMQKGRSV